MELEVLEKALNDKFDAQVKALEKMRDEGATKVELQACIKSIENQGEILEKIKSQIKEKTIKSYLGQLEDFLIDKADSLAELVKNKQGMIEFVPKAVGNISTGSGANAETPDPNQNTRLSSFNLRNDNALLGLCTVTNTNSASHPYTEMLPKEGEYAFVAEGGVKPQIDFKWENRYADPKKVAAYEVLSTEVVQDIQRILTTAREYLSKKHDLFKVDAIYFGDASSAEIPKGATEYGRTFSADGMALGVVNPNFMDIVNACITDIYTTTNFVDEAPYMANVCMINPTDFYLQLVSAKDENGLPLYPQAGLFNQVTIGGVTIKPWIKIPAGKIFVADMKKYNVSNYIPFAISIGWINNQFITNQFTMLGESRFFAYVKKLDEQAFLYDDLAVIETAIAKV
jgi:hypothetical protein